MTTRTDRVEEIFQDAHDLQADALEMLALAGFANPEKAWGATKRASDALGLGTDRRARPPTTAMTTGAADVGRHFTHISCLHGTCFHDGLFRSGRRAVGPGQEAFDQSIP